MQDTREIRGRHKGALFELTQPITLTSISQIPRSWSVFRIDSLALRRSLTSRPPIFRTSIAKGCFLRSKVVTAVNFEKSDFTSANLTRANFVGSTLIEANFKNANLMEANLTSANILNVNFEGANLNGAIWTDGSKCGVNSIGECKK